jgi:hypothetical protein
MCGCGVDLGVTAVLLGVLQVCCADKSNQNECRSVVVLYFQLRLDAFVGRQLRAERKRDSHPLAWLYLRRSGGLTLLLL